MDKTVDKIAFWEERLAEARHNGNLSSSVFWRDKWACLDSAHKNVLDSLLGPLDSVLDAGCGYGRAVDLIPGKSYVGVDQVPAFIALACEAYYWRRLPSKDWKDISFDNWNLETLPYKNNSFDWVVGISLMVMIIENLGWKRWQVTQEELLRVSKNGILCLEYTDPEVYYVIKGR